MGKRMNGICLFYFRNVKRDHGAVFLEGQTDAKNPVNITR